jgi:hypothetical protein
MTGMSDPTQTPGQPSPEEMRAYLEQLRESDPAGLIAEAFNLLATGAQVKLGRPDARALIDGIAGMVSGAGEALPPELAEQMNEGVAQLQMAQVQAEREAGGQSEPQPDPAASSGPADQPPAMPSAPPRTSSPGEGGQQSMTDRLWVPGRDPRPPTR